MTCRGGVVFNELLKRLPQVSGRLGNCVNLRGRGRGPFKAQRFAIEELVVGKPQLEHDVHWTDIAARRLDQRVAQIRNWNSPRIRPQELSGRHRRSVGETVDDDTRPLGRSGERGAERKCLVRRARTFLAQAELRNGWL